MVRSRDLDRAAIALLHNVDGGLAHVLKAKQGRGMAAHVLIYADDFIVKPITLQLKSSLNMMFSARKMMTLFLFYDSQVATDSTFESTAMARVLTDSVVSFLNQPGVLD